MKVTVSIRNPDGIIRTFEDDFEWNDDSPEEPGARSAESKAIWQWTDGNFGCDCNRALFFARSGGEEDLDFPCSGAVPTFKVEMKNEAGVFYSEF